MEGLKQFRRQLGEWFDGQQRDLPWRRTKDPYRIWISETMLQQTRVSAVIPYYERFLERFPDVGTLAGAPEQDLLMMWSGLGYYSRARNLQKAAKAIAALGGFPRDYEAIRGLAGVGDYTAAAVASIAFDLPHAALDGNVLRVITRLDNDPGDIGSAKVKKRLQRRADELLDSAQPGRFNQAMMELGATLCVPRQPRCLLCPVAAHCQARVAGTVGELPVKLRKTEIFRVERTLLYIEKDGHLLLRQRGKDEKRLASFWELPEPEEVPGAKLGQPVTRFRHSITNHIFLFQVVAAKLSNIPMGFRWVPKGDLIRIPLSTTTRKALAGLDD